MWGKEMHSVVRYARGGKMTRGTRRKAHLELASGSRMQMPCIQGEGKGI